MTYAAKAAALDAGVAVRGLLDCGFGPFIGVPCSHLGPIVSWCECREPGLYVTANNEGEAVAIAAGAQLAGRSPVVMLQNSGLGNAVNPLTSLCSTLRIPVLLIVSWRGSPGRRDEPQHELMGRITVPLLELMDVEHELIETDPERFAAQARRLAARLRDHSLPAALVVPPGALGEDEPEEPERGGLARRSEVIAAVVGPLPDDVVVVATTGKTARELAAWRDRSANLYVVGSMGCASSIALGIATAAEGRGVVVLDGDGAALMRLEALVSIGAARPSRLVHVVLDNIAYESTGSQRTNSASVDFPAVASACGYSTAATTDDPAAAAELVRAGLAGGGPHFVHVRIAVGSASDLGRPERRPPEVAEEFRRVLAT